MTHEVMAGRLGVHGASLRYEVLGSGPVLALVGHPMGADDVRDLAEQLAGERTALLHDPRGLGASPLEDPSQDADPEVLADDLARLLREVTDAPAEVVASSGGAVTASPSRPATRSWCGRSWRTSRPCSAPW